MELLGESRPKNRLVENRLVSSSTHTELSAGATSEPDQKLEPPLLVLLQPGLQPP